MTIRARLGRLERRRPLRRRSLEELIDRARRLDLTTSTPTDTPEMQAIRARVRALLKTP